MILLEAPSRVLQQIFQNRLRNMEKPAEVDFHLIEFDDIRFHVQASAKDPQHILLSIAVPPPPLETVFGRGLPFGALEAVKAAYGPLIKVIQPPEAGFHLTIQIDVMKLATSEAEKVQQMTKLASLRTPWRPVQVGTSCFCHMTKIPEQCRDSGIELKPYFNEWINLKDIYYNFYRKRPEKVTAVFPMRYKDNNDVVLATLFLQEFMESYSFSRGDFMYKLKGDVDFFRRMECNLVISWTPKYSILIVSTQSRKHLRIVVGNNVLE